MRWFGLLFSVFFVFGCSAIVSPDEDRLGEGPGGSDSGMGEDTAIRLMDSGGDTIPPPPDTSMIDTQPGCTERDPRCEDDTLVECIDGTVVTTSCQMLGAFCDGSECRDWECTPGEARCDGDGRVAICDDRGASESRMDCPFGCDPDTNMCLAMPMICPGVPPLAPGAMVRVNTCGMGDDSTHEPVGETGRGCPSGERANGADIVYAITLTSRQTVVIDLRDDHEGVAIDTVVYLRRDCEDRESQLACSDDLECDTTVFGCSDGSRIEVRQSRIVTTLDPGTYYVIIDTFNYTSGRTRFTCGDVLLSYNVGSVSGTP